MHGIREADRTDAPQSPCQVLHLASAYKRNMEPRSSLPPEIFEGPRSRWHPPDRQPAGCPHSSAGLRPRSVAPAAFAHWQPPAIFAWETWTASLWQQRLIAGTAGRILLNTSQELHIWRSIVACRPTPHQPAERSTPWREMAAQAWKLLCAYRGQSRLGATRGQPGHSHLPALGAGLQSTAVNSDLYLSPSELDAALASSRRSLPATDTSA